MYEGIGRINEDYDGGGGDGEGWGGGNKLWTERYAPKSGREVMQLGGEMRVLRNWLIKLKGKILEQDGKLTNKGIGRDRKGNGRVRRRNKRGGYGDWSDNNEEYDEDEDYEEFGEGEGYNEGEFRVLEQKEEGKRVSLVKRKQIKARHHSKIDNCILISGPYGCGKTAGVYAVARELGYDVFEINASSRRSGKDVMDKVGNMTENHLIGRVGSADDGEVSKKGREGKGVNKGGGDKKHSLILLEDADVLFEEDRQFWETVKVLSRESKRPIVITCRDENLLSFDVNKFHAVLRFEAPPEDLVADYLVVMAAREGHLIERSSMINLYRSKGYDLRASIMTINFWCQMGLYDEKGGLEWFYQRWPHGSDVDEKGERMMVVSRGTYRSGLDWIGREVYWVLYSKGRIEELGEFCDQYEMDMEEVYREVKMDKQQELVIMERNSLENMEWYFEGRSANDLICRRAQSLGSSEDQVDATNWPFDVVSRADFPLGNRLLPADPSANPSAPLRHTALACVAVLLDGATRTAPPPQLSQPLRNPDKVVGRLIRLKTASPLLPAGAIDPVSYSGNAFLGKLRTRCRFAR